MKPLPDFIQMIGPYMYPDENDGTRIDLDSRVRDGPAVLFLSY